MTLAIQALHEPYAHLYVGDYFADTLDLSAHEHCALRLLLLETWVRGPVGNVRLASVAGLTKEEWQVIKSAVLPLLRGVQPRIVESLNYIRNFDGQRLKQLEADHILPLSRGGSNALVNLATACRPCNLSKGSKAVEDWAAPGPRSPRPAYSYVVPPVSPCSSRHCKSDRLPSCRRSSSQAACRSQAAATSM